MVKGVSKTVIEVNNTGSKLFDRIVFYVTPEYSTLSAKQLRKAANSFTFNYELSQKKLSLRKHYKRKKLLTAVGVISLILIAIITALIIIL